MMTFNKTRQRGFTLLELMGVLLILSVLISLLLPAVQQAREAARRTQCRNNMFQLGVAFANYQMTHSVLPPGCISRPGYEGQPEAINRISWVAQLLPFIEEKGLHQQINFSIPELSFISSEELEKHRKVKSLWIEMRTLQGLPLTAAPTNPPAGEPMAETPEDDANDMSISPDAETSESQATTSSEQAGDSPDDKVATEPTAAELQRAARITELETALSDLGYFDFDKEPMLPSASTADSSTGGMGSMFGQTTSTPMTGAPRILHCPSRPNQNVSYSGSHNSTEIPISADADGLLYVDSSESLRAIPDGAAATILAGENATSSIQPIEWMFGNSATLRNGGPMSTDADRMRGINQDGLVSDFSGMSQEARGELIKNSSLKLGPFGSYHSFEQVNFLFADGSVKALSSRIDVTTLRRMISRNDGF